jgi:murein DD-endopeptidase MepM/ murein hydrolase activator NlpD
MHRTLLRTLSAALVLGFAAWAALERKWPWRPAAAVATPTLAEIFTHTADTLRRGETLSELFARQGVKGFTLAERSDRTVFDPRRLRAGLVFNFARRLADSIPFRVVVRTGPEERVTLRLAGGSWMAEREPVAWRAEPVVLEGAIESSLYEALDGEIPDSVLSGAERVRLAWDLADVFAWQVDFSRDLRSGDRFRVLAQRLVSEEGEVRFGRVLAGDLTVDGTRFTAWYFDGGPGARGYFDDHGRSLRRAFLLAPVEFRRISSRPGARRHPVLGTIRRHEGIDYAADVGTPVLAAGDGIVLRREWSGGYGNLIELRHANGITTRYGHLDGFAPGLQVGARVRQGEVLGYVGSTGLATGPHLHYEFRIHGVARDPRQVDFGTGEPIPASARPAFAQERLRLAALLWGVPGRLLATASP